MRLVEHRTTHTTTLPLMTGHSNFITEKKKTTFGQTVIVLESEKWCGQVNALLHTHPQGSFSNSILTINKVQYQLMSLRAHNGFMRL